MTRIIFSVGCKFFETLNSKSMYDTTRARQHRFNGFEEVYMFDFDFTLYSSKLIRDC